MKKTVLAIIFVMMLALAVTASAQVETITPGSDGLYTINFDLADAGLSDVEDGTMFGMVVIEAAEGEEFALTEGSIRYIDQGEAEDGALVFEGFAPMDLKNDGQYQIYIGGEGLKAATQIAILAEEVVAPTPVVKSVSLDKNSASVKVGETVTLVATVEDADAEYTLVWESNDTSVATVANGVVTGVKAGTATITVTAAEGVTATATITVEEDAVVEPEAVLGDVNVDGVKNANDAIFLLRHVSLPMLYPTTYTGSKDFNKDGTASAADAVYLLRHISLPALYPISW